MCAIAGFSLSTSSRINPRKLAHALLVEMDVRGNQASGFAYQSSTGSGVFKKDVAGANLSVKPMSKGTRLAVLHTRYATHGTIRDMANNHPVMSPDKSVALVHNGVIYNHDQVRAVLPHKLAEVDTAVIPALLQEFDRDTEHFSKLDGDASVAWLDDNDRLVLRVARVSHSPLCIAQLQDGSFVFASTESILLKALSAIGLDPVYVENVPERVLLTVRDGILTDVDALPSLDPAYEMKYNYNTSSYRSMTSGGHSTANTIGYQFSNPANNYNNDEPYGWQFGDSQADWDYYRSLEKDDVNDNPYGYPEVDGFTVNEFGEYYDESGYFIGTIDDFIEMGYIYPEDFTPQNIKKINAQTSMFTQKYVDNFF